MLLCKIVTSSHRQIKIGEICEGGGGKETTARVISTAPRQPLSAKGFIDTAVTFINFSAPPRH